MLKVLIVDDIEINIKVISSILSFKKDIQVFQALGAKEALNIMKNNHFDIIITDIFMPDMDGFLFADIIYDNHNKIPIIAVSAGDSDVKDNCNLHNIKYFLSKPIIPTKLYTIIDEITLKKTPMIKNISQQNNFPESKLLTRLKDYTGGNINLLKKLLGKFIEILPIRINEITSLLLKDYQIITEEKIHNLKGFSLVYVSEQTGDKIKEFEQFIKISTFNESKDTRITKFESLKIEFYKDFDELKKIYNLL